MRQPAQVRDEGRRGADREPGIHEVVRRIASGELVGRSHAVHPRINSVGTRMFRQLTVLEQLLL